jgi:GMP synthase (glutamine-hydrolysing)
MDNKILIVNLCKEKLHYYEFVKPIEDILRQGNSEYETISYKKLKEKIIKKYKKIIICGTSLRDEEYLENLNNFEWIKDYKGKLLGICAGMQLICKIFGCELERKQDIGMKMISIKRDFLGVKGWKEVYELHNFEILRNPTLEKEFEIYSQGSLDVIKHKEKETYAVLFHPEVRQKEIIISFANLE